MCGTTPTIPCFDDEDCPTSETCLEQKYPDIFESLEDVRNRNFFKSGTIPAEVGDMAALTEIDFANSGLIGTIPPSLAKLTNLRRLFLDGNNFSGPLAPEIIALCSSSYLKRQQKPADGKRLDEVRCKLGKATSGNGKTIGSPSFTLPDDWSTLIPTFQYFVDSRKEFCCTDEDCTAGDSVLDTSKGGKYPRKCIGGDAELPAVFLRPTGIFVSNAVNAGAGSITVDRTIPFGVNAGPSTGGDSEVNRQMNGRVIRQWAWRMKLGKNANPISRCVGVCCFSEGVAAIDSLGCRACSESHTPCSCPESEAAKNACSLPYGECPDNEKCVGYGPYLPVRDGSTPDPYSFTYCGAQDTCEGKGYTWKGDIHVYKADGTDIGIVTDETDATLTFAGSTLSAVGDNEELYRDDRPLVEAFLMSTESDRLSPGYSMGDPITGEMCDKVCHARAMAQCRHQCRGMCTPIARLVDTNLQGTIPASIADADDLEALLLNDNELTGGIPKELANLEKLVDLRITKNQLTGCMPRSLDPNQEGACTSRVKCEYDAKNAQNSTIEVDRVQDATGGAEGFCAIPAPSPDATNPSYDAWKAFYERFSVPTARPTAVPTSASPTAVPSNSPSSSPSTSPSDATEAPTVATDPTYAPTAGPTVSPSTSPSSSPSKSPTEDLGGGGGGHGRVLGPSRTSVTLEMELLRKADRDRRQLGAVATTAQCWDDAGAAFTHRRLSGDPPPPPPPTASPTTAAPTVEPPPVSDTLALCVPPGYQATCTSETPCGCSPDNVQCSGNTIVEIRFPGCARLEGAEVSEVLELLSALPDLLQIDLKNSGLVGSLPAAPSDNWKGTCEATTATSCWDDEDCPNSETCVGALQMLDLSGNDIYGTITPEMETWLKRRGGIGTACGVAASAVFLSGNSVVCPDSVASTASEFAEGMPCVHTCEPGQYGVRGIGPCTQCADGEFANAKGAEACTPCPETGVTCAGVAKVLANHWRAGGADAATLASDTLIYPCFNDAACLLDAATETVVTCAEGYAPDGVLCGICEEGTHVRKGNVCVACDGIGDKATLKSITSVVQGLVLFLLILFYITRPPHDDEVAAEENLLLAQANRLAGHAAVMDLATDAAKAAGGARKASVVNTTKDLAQEEGESAADDAASAAAGGGGAYDDADSDLSAIDTSVLEGLTHKFKIFVGYGQITGFVDSVFTIKWPAAFTDLTAQLRSLNADIMGILGGLACTLSSDFAEGFIELMLVIPSVLAVCGAAYGVAVVAFVGKKRKDGKPEVTKASAQTRVFKFISFIIFLMYPGIAVRLFTWFKCTKVGDKFYLDADYNIVCFESGTWMSYFPLVLILIGVYVPANVSQNTVSDRTHCLHSYGPDSHSRVVLCNFMTGWASLWACSGCCASTTRPARSAIRA